MLKCKNLNTFKSYDLNMLRLNSLNMHKYDNLHMILFVSNITVTIGIEKNMLFTKQIIDFTYLNSPVFDIKFLCQILVPLKLNWFILINLTQLKKYQIIKFVKSFDLRKLNNQQLLQKHFLYKSWVTNQRKLMSTPTQLSPFKGCLKRNHSFFSGQVTSEKEGFSYHVSKNSIVPQKIFYQNFFTIGITLDLVRFVIWICLSARILIEYKKRLQNHFILSQCYIIKYNHAIKSLLSYKNIGLHAYSQNEICEYSNNNNNNTNYSFNYNITDHDNNNPNNHSSSNNNNNEDNSNDLNSKDDDNNININAIAKRGNGNNSILVFTQINLHRAKAPSYQLIQYMKQISSDIGLLTEPWLNNNLDISGLDGLKLVYFKGDMRIRAAIAYNNNVNLWPMPEFCDNDVAAAMIKYENEEIVICSAYMDITINEIPQTLINLTKYCNRTNKKLIIGADTNSHSMLWGSIQNNARGDLIEAYIFGNCLEICNDGLEVTFTGKNDEFSTYIDVTLTSHNLTQQIIEWKVDTDNSSLSDHRYITFKLNNFSTNNTTNTEYDVRTCNWNKFKIEINMYLQRIYETNIESSNDLDRVANILEKSIMNALSKSCTSRKIVHRKVNKWWTAELNQMRKDLRKLRCQYKKTKPLKNVYWNLN